MMEILQREGIYLWYYFSLQLSQIFRYWVLGMVLGSAISVFAKEHIHGLFRSLQGKRLGVLGILIASALGIASPLCMYGTIPLAASFSESGMEDDWLAAFMMSSILLNPQLILYSMALGRTALAIRILSSFLCGTGGRAAHPRFLSETAFFQFRRFFRTSEPGYRPESVFAVPEKPWAEYPGNRRLFPAWHCAFRIVPAICPRRYGRAAVRRERRLWRADGGNHRRTALRLRRWDNPAFAGVAGGWDEPWKRGSVHGYRPRYQNHESGGSQNCAGRKAVRPVSGVYDSVRADNGMGR